MRKSISTNNKSVFHDKRDPKQKAQSQGYPPGQSPDDLKRIIGELTVQNAHPKKSLGAAGEVTTAHKVELAYQLCQPNGPYSKSQVARALGIARSTLYLQGKQAKKDKQVAIAIETWHEQDDTLGHRKLAILLKMGKNRVKRVMRKYGMAARRKREARTCIQGKPVVLCRICCENPKIRSCTKSKKSCSLISLKSL